MVVKYLGSWNIHDLRITGPLCGGINEVTSGFPTHRSSDGFFAINLDTFGKKQSSDL